MPETQTSVLTGNWQAAVIHVGDRREIFHALGARAIEGVGWRGPGIGPQGVLNPQMYHTRVPDWQQGGKAFADLLNILAAKEIPVLMTVRPGGFRCTYLGPVPGHPAPSVLYAEANTPQIALCRLLLGMCRLRVLPWGGR